MRWRPCSVGRMITLLPGLPANTVGFRVDGKVDASDYADILQPAIATALATGQPVNGIVVLGPHFDQRSATSAAAGLDFGELLDQDWGRLAVVSNHMFINMMIKMYAAKSPYDVRRFSLSQEAQAISWATTGRA